VIHTSQGPDTDPQHEDTPIKHCQIDYFCLYKDNNPIKDKPLDVLGGKM
jgi:hypothetical protein